MLNGDFELLGGRQEVPYYDLSLSLERMANVLSNSFPTNPPSCTLNLVPKTVSLGNSLAFGLVGALISAGVDSVRKEHFKTSFKEGKLFDAEWAEGLIHFVERHGWRITISGK